MQHVPQQLQIMTTTSSEGDMNAAQQTPTAGHTCLKKKYCVARSCRKYIKLVGVSENCCHNLVVLYTAALATNEDK